MLIPLRRVPGDVARDASASQNAEGSAEAAALLFELRALLGQLIPLLTARASDRGPGPEETDRLLYRPKALSAVLGLSRSKVYELLASGVLPSIKIAGSVRVPRAALEEWIRAQTRRADAE